MCVCVCVCVCGEREYVRKLQIETFSSYVGGVCIREIEGEREREGERECVCVCSKSRNCSHCIINGSEMNKMLATNVTNVFFPNFFCPDFLRCDETTFSGTVG